jgi:signal transduction histidine kinase/CheY-like chemotaxis protein
LITSNTANEPYKIRSKYFDLFKYSLISGVLILFIVFIFQKHMSENRTMYQTSIVNSLLVATSSLVDLGDNGKINSIMSANLNFEYLAKIQIFNGYGDIVSSQHGAPKKLSSLEYIASLYCGYETETFRSTIFSVLGENINDVDRKLKSGDVIVEFYLYGRYSEYLYLYGFFSFLWISSIVLVAYFQFSQLENFNSILKAFLYSTGRTQDIAPKFYVNGVGQLFLFKSILNSIDMSSFLKINASEKANKNISAIMEEQDKLSMYLNSTKSSYFTYRQYVIFTASDMRNLVSGMSIDIEAMLSVPLNEYQEVRCKRISFSLGLIKNLINDSIDFASDGIGDSLLVGDPVDVYLLTDVVMSYMGPVVGNSIKIHTVFDVSESNYLFINKKLFHSIFSNLVFSSSKLLSSGNIIFNVGVSSQDDGKCFLTITISGSGKRSDYDKILPSGFDHLIKSMGGVVHKDLDENMFILKVEFKVNSHNKYSQQQLKLMDVAKLEVLKIAIVDNDIDFLRSIKSKFSIIGMSVDTYDLNSDIGNNYNILIGSGLASDKDSSFRLKEHAKCLISIENSLDSDIMDVEDSSVDLMIDSSLSIYEMFEKVVQYYKYLSLDRIGGASKTSISGISNPFADLMDPSSRQILEGYRILLVASNSFNRSAIMDQLRIFGAEVNGCSGIKDCGVWLGANRVDLIISDIDVDDGLGIDIFPILTENPVNLGVKVIGLASMGYDSSEMLNSGYMAVFNKPFDIDNLINIVLKKVKKRPFLAVVSR